MENNQDLYPLAEIPTTGLIAKNNQDKGPLPEKRTTSLPGKQPGGDSSGRESYNQLPGKNNHRSVPLPEKGTTGILGNNQDKTCLAEISTTSFLPI